MAALPSVDTGRLGESAWRRRRDYSDAERPFEGLWIADCRLGCVSVVAVSAGSSNEGRFLTGAVRNLSLFVPSSPRAFVPSFPCVSTKKQARAGLKSHVLPELRGATPDSDSMGIGMNVQTKDWRPAQVAVAAETDDEPVGVRAQTLALELGLPLLVRHEYATGVARGLKIRTAGDGQPAPDLLLVVGETRLELRENRRGAASVCVDFVRGPTGFRRRRQSRSAVHASHRQPLARAVGLRHGFVSVVDATAGLARDAFLLACLGCRVTAIERSEILAALIRDGLRRAAAEGSPDLHAVLDRMTLAVGDARELLAVMPETAAPQVVYLDPMYPPRQKAALPQKEMQICRRLVGDEGGAGELLAVARRVARHRVVVKRPRRAAPLCPGPDLQFSGKQVRYDVYLTAAGRSEVAS